MVDFESCLVLKRSLIAAIALFLGSASTHADQDRLIEFKGQPVSGVVGDVVGLIVDRDDVLWIGTDSFGIFACRDGKFTLYDVYNTPIPDNRIAAIYVDQNSVKWFLSGRGYLYSFDNVKWRVSPGISKWGGGYDVKSLRRDSKGRTWLWLRNDGFVRIENGELKWINPTSDDNKADPATGAGQQPEFGRFEVTGMDVDRQGRIWAATSKALVRSDGDSWTWFAGDKLPAARIFGFWCNPRDGHVYLATNNGLFAFKDGKHRLVEAADISARLDVLRGTRANWMAFSFLAGGISALDEEPFSRYAANTPLKSGYSKIVAFDGRGRAWFLGSGRLHCLDGGKWTLLELQNRDGSWERSPTKRVLRHSSPQDLVRQDVLSTDIHEVLKNPIKYGGRKICIAGTIAATPGLPEMIDANHQSLGIWSEEAAWLWDFIDRPEIKKDLGGNDQPREFVGYLDWGDRFGTRGFLRSNSPLSKCIR